MSEPKHRRTILAIPLVLAGFIAALVVQFRPGIRVTVTNAGTAPLNAVVLHATGAAYDLGDILPDASTTMRVNPTSDSHLEIGFTGADGQAHRLNVDVYFSRDSRGTIRVSIKDGRIENVEDNIKLW